MSWICLFAVSLNGRQLSRIFFLLKIKKKTSPFFDISFYMILEKLNHVLASKILFKIF